MRRITEFEVFCGFGINFVVIAVTTVIGVLVYTI